MTAMAKAFSKIGIALSSGAFESTVNIVQRGRQDVTVTVVPKAPVWFLAMACIWYAFLLLVAFVIALFLIKNPDVRRAQHRFGLQSVHNINDALKKGWRKKLKEGVMGSDDDEHGRPRGDSDREDYGDIGEEGTSDEGPEEETKEKKKKKQRRRIKWWYVTGQGKLILPLRYASKYFRLASIIQTIFYLTRSWSSSATLRGLEGRKENINPYSIESVILRYFLL